MDLLYETKFVEPWTGGPLPLPYGVPFFLVEKPIYCGVSCERNRPSWTSNGLLFESAWVGGNSWKKRIVEQCGTMVKHSFLEIFTINSGYYWFTIVTWQKWTINAIHKPRQWVMFRSQHSLRARVRNEYQWIPASKKHLTNGLFPVLWFYMALIYNIINVTLSIYIYTYGLLWFYISPDL